MYIYIYIHINITSNLGFFPTVWGTSWMTWNSRLSSFAANSTGSFDSVDWPLAATAREESWPLQHLLQKEKRVVSDMWVIFFSKWEKFCESFCGWMIQKIQKTIENAMWLTPSFLTATHPIAKPASSSKMSEWISTHKYLENFARKLHENPASKSRL